jgi:uncharacterized phiE125 gp8 family phage protein
MKINYTITNLQKIEIWSLGEVKNYLRISHDYDDGLLSGLLDAAIESVELFTGVSLNIRSFMAKIQSVSSSIPLKHIPVLDIDSVILKKNGQDIDITADFGVVLNGGAQVAIDEKYVGEDLEVQYQAGYREDLVPRAIKHGILMHVSDMYENSVDAVALSSQIKDLYAPYRVIKI